MDKVPEIKWMQCPQCKKCVLKNLSGICLACQRVCSAEDQTDSFENQKRCKRCGRTLPIVDPCMICEWEGKDAVQK